MQSLLSRSFRSLLVLSLYILVLPGTILLAPDYAQAFGGLTENGTAAFMGIGINPTKILHVSGTGPGTVPLFQRASDSAGFIIERTPTNRWVLGVNESPTLGNGFVLSTIPTGTQSVPRLMITPAGRVGIGTVSPDTLSRLHVLNTDNTSSARAIYGETLGSDTYGVYGKSTNTSGGYGVFGTSGEFGNAIKGENPASGTSGYIGGPSWAVAGERSDAKGRLGGTGGDGVYGESSHGNASGVYGSYLGAGTGSGVYGQANGAGLTGYGVYGRNGVTGPYGYLGDSSYGVYGRNGDHGPLGYIGSSSYGVHGQHNNGNYGQLGTATYGVFGYGMGSNGGVYGQNVGTGNNGELGGNKAAVSGQSSGSNYWAGDFWGCVRVTDNLTVSDNLTVGTRAGIGMTSQPNSTLQVQGSFSTAFRLVDVNDNITASDSIIAVDASEDERVVTLPTAVGCKGRTYTIKKIDSLSAEVIVNGSGAETIDGAAEYVLDDQWEMVTIVSDGSNWLIISKYNPPIT